MPRRRDRRDRRERYMRDRAERQMRRDERRRNRDYGYPMDYNYDYPEYASRYDFGMGRDRYHDEERYMGREQPRESSRVYYDYDMRRGRDYRGDYRGGRDYRDYADDDYDREYHEDLKEWTEKLKKYDRFNMPKEQLIQSARQMGVNFEDYDEDEFYAVYLMQVSDYPTIANEPRIYLGMAKSWLEDKDIKLDGSDKLCKYMYEIAMAEDDD